MTTYNEQLQKVWHDYERELGYVPASLRDALKWGVSEGRIEAPVPDPYDKLVEDMSRALREEYATDRLGRRYRVNHAVRVSKAGVQHTMWAIMGNAPRSHMQKAFIQRREQIVGDCVQLSTDVAVYNDLNRDQPPLPMLFDFRDDIAERQTWEDDEAA
jgi:hypothetical protein